jgi:hypothetical protein
MKSNLSLLVFLVFLFNISCMGKINNNTKEKENILEVPVVLDSLTIMHFSADSLVKRNGKPASDLIFQMKETGRDKRILRQFFSYDSNVEIRELKWNIDSENYLLIWYFKQNDEWKPITFSFRDINAEY